MTPERAPVPEWPEPLDGMDRRTHLFADQNPEALCPFCGFASWMHDPAQVFMRTQRVAALSAHAPEPLVVIAAERERAGIYEVPCCYSLHEFEQVCPRTGRTFIEKGGAS
jgi:hypothetical protein